jgi:hypothetical protein
LLYISANESSSSNHNGPSINADKEGLSTEQIQEGVVAGGSIHYPTSQQQQNGHSTTATGGAPSSHQQGQGGGSSGGDGGGQNIYKKKYFICLNMIFIYISKNILLIKI